jgi:hypothetical protein
MAIPIAELSIPMQKPWMLGSMSGDSKVPAGHI